MLKQKTEGAKRRIVGIEPIKITKGNDFHLRLIPSEAAPGDNRTFAALSDIRCFLVRPYRAVEVPCAVDGDGALDISVTADKVNVLGRYGLEVTADDGGSAYRYKEACAIEIVDTSAEATATANETFGADYYDIEANVLTHLNERIITLTQEEYDSLAEYERDTYYVIINESES